MHDIAKFPKEICFSSKQAQHALLRNDTYFFIQPETPIEVTRWCNLLVEFHPLPREESSSGVSKNVTSNDLVLCFVASENEVNFYIINPITQSCSPIPTTDHIQNRSFYDHKIGFLCKLDGNFMIYHFIDNLVEWFSYFDCKVYKDGVWKQNKDFSVVVEV